MTVSAADSKKLWGLAAGICSRPGCGQDLVLFLDEANPTVLGEMAHVIAKSPAGPRGTDAAGEDTYENLILLCPTCHRMVDKAPAGTYSEDVLREWKSKHEALRQQLVVPRFDSRAALADYVLRRLIENHAVWKQYGPESDVAKTNPVSNVAQLWVMRKLAYVIPNNTRIIRVLEANDGLLTAEEYEIARSFVEHAHGFEATTYERRDNVPRFPTEFEEMIRRVATPQQLGCEVLSDLVRRGCTCDPCKGRGFRSFR